MNEIELQKHAVEIAEQSEIIVDSAESYEYAGEVVIQIDTASKRVEEFFRDIKKQAHDAWKAICNKESEYLKPLKAARQELVGKISSWATEQERIRKEEQARAEALAQQKAEEERARLEAAAAQAREAGAEEFAEALQDQAAATAIIPEIVAPTVDKTMRVSGGAVTQKKDLEIKISDLRAFLQALCQEKNLPADLIKVQESKLKTWIKLHGMTNFPGLQIREKLAPTFRKAG